MYLKSHYTPSESLTPPTAKCVSNKWVFHKSHDEHQSSNHNKSYALTLFSPVEGSAGATLHTKVHILTSLNKNLVKIVLYMNHFRKFSNKKWFWGLVAL